MRDKELYARILGIEAPWTVFEIDLNTKDGEVAIMVRWKDSVPLTCPECGKAVPGYDTRRRRWRHLDTCQYRTYLEAEIPRTDCVECGVKQIAVPWAEEGSRFTALYEALVIDWLGEANLSAVARRLNLSWDEVDGVMSRAVHRGLARRETAAPVRIGVDETSYRKRHDYVTVVSDQDTNRVVYVGEGRKTAVLEAYYRSLTAEMREGIEVVSMDMWRAYITATEKWLPEAKIAFDKFHVAKHLGDAVDRVRREEHRSLLARGDDRLKGTRYWWLWNPENMDADRWHGEFAVLRKSALRTARAWALKEAAMLQWDYRVRGWAKRAWTKWINWGRRCGLEPMKRAAAMIRDHLEGILNAILLDATNAGSESINAKIQKVKSRACGYRNRTRFRHAILFHLGGLNLYPSTHTIS